MAEDKARDRRESLDSGRERNAVFRSQGPDVARMDFFNGLLWTRLRKGGDSIVSIAPLLLHADAEPQFHTNC